MSLVVPPEHGSSPLARGTAPGSTPSATARRFIPAGAGNSSCCSQKKLSNTVHPRWRGEQRGARGVGECQRGSSPLARGTVFQVGAGSESGRFIPAGAGNSNPGRGVPGFGAVHPRWRGEQIDGSGRSSTSTGSSPLARGTANYVGIVARMPRFIPAGAGNSSCP